MIAIEVVPQRVRSGAADGDAVAEHHAAVGEQRDLEIVAVALGEAGQALQLHVLDQPAAMRLVLGFLAKLRDLRGRGRRRARIGNRRESKRRQHEARADAPRHDQAMRPEVGELGLAA